MTPDKFQAIVAKRIEKIRSLIESKGREYVRGDTDRLANFKRLAMVNQESVESAWLGVASKQMIAVMDMCIGSRTPSQPFPLALWEERIGDSIVYLILLEAIVKEIYNVEP